MGLLKSEDQQKDFFHYDLYTQPVKGSKRRDRKEDHLTTVIRMGFFLDNCNQGAKSKVIPVVISQSRSQCELQCRSGRETKSEQVQATAEPKPKLHQEISIGLILVC